MCGRLLQGSARDVGRRKRALDVNLSAPTRMEPEECAQGQRSYEGAVVRVDEATVNIENVDEARSYSCQ